jgi:hypothetical protein
MSWMCDVSEKKKVSTSFLKKRSKKLLSLGPSLLSTNTVPADRIDDSRDKSFLLLFFKKEVLSSFLSL